MIALAGAVFLSLAAFSAPAEESQHQPAGDKPKRSAGPFPDDVPGLEDVAGQAIAEDNALRLLQATILLRRQRPHEPRYLASMVRAYAMLGKPTSAYHYMLQMQQQGLSYDFDKYEYAASLRGTEVYDYLNDLLVRAGEPAGEAEAAFTLDGSVSLPAALAWDESRGRFLVGTAGDGLILAVDEDGEVSELLRAGDDNGLWSITDLEVDEERNRLWVSSAAIPVFSGFDAGDAGQSALFEFELDSLQPLARYPVVRDGLARELGPLAIAPNGDVFAADRLTPVVYRKPADADKLSAFVGHPEMVAFRDMTISADGKRLYIADVARGILVVDPENQTAAVLEGPETLNLGGIEAVFHADEHLVIVQPGIEPQRLMSLKLDASGGTVIEVRPMAIALEAFDGPSFGTVKDEAVYYFADVRLTQPGETARPVTVLKTPLDAGDTIIAPDMRKFEEETLSKARNN